MPEAHPTTACRLRAALGPPKPLDRRSRPRYRIGAVVSCNVLRGGEPVACLRVLNLSRRGAGLLLPIPVAAGETLLVSLSTRLGLHVHRTALRVARCVEALQLGFVVGGAFAEPLSLEYWQVLLG
jgi:hypothetical protein